MNRHRSSRGKRGGGYTLLEILIVVAVLGIAGAMVVPHLVDQDHLHVQAAVRQLIADLSFAQSDALAHQEHRKVEFIVDSGTGLCTEYCIVRVTSANYSAAYDEDTADFIEDPLARGGTLKAYVRNFTLDPRFADVVISSVSIDGGRTGIVYDPLGGTIRTGDLPGTGGTIELMSGDDAYEVTIAPFTGKLTVVKKAG